MLDRGARGIIARGNPRELREHSDDPRVRAFFNRQPSLTMATTATNHWKLGLFVVLAIAVA